MKARQARKVYYDNPWLKPAKDFLAEIKSQQSFVSSVTLLAFICIPLLYNAETDEFFSLT